MPAKMPPPFADAHEVVVLFSGGRDSSLAACLLLDAGVKVHLLTCDDGSYTNFQISHYRVQEIQRIFPDNLVTRVVAPTYGLFRKIALECIESDFALFKKNLIILGSQLATHAEAVLYCMRHNIQYVASGFTQYESHLPEQMTQSIRLLRDFTEEYGLAYMTPVYAYDSADAVKYRLFEMGLSTKSLEAFSIFSDSSSTATAELIADYIHAKLPICREYIASRSLSVQHLLENG